MSRVKSFLKKLTAWTGTAITCFLLASLVFLTDYLHLPQFGLYEDDYTRIPSAVAMSGGEVLSTLAAGILELQGQGRPLHQTLIYFFAHVGERLGGLQVTYAFGFSWVTLNVCLYYFLLRRLASTHFALLGALAFVVFPADTTQPFLTHALGLQPSLAFLLLAMHAYLCNRRWFTYPLAVLCLFTYETTFPVLLAAPLLHGTYDRRKLRELGQHAAFLAAILLAAFLLRASVAEGRVGNLAFPTVLLTPLRHMVIGPVVTAAMYVYRPVQVLSSLDLQLLLLTGLGAVVFGAIHWITGTGAGTLKQNADQTAARGNQLRKRVSSIAASIRTLPWRISGLPQRVVAGAAMLILAYPLTFTIRSFTISGRATRVHFAAVVGASLLAACLLSWLLSLRRRKRIIPAVLALGFGLLLAHGLLVQRDYVRSWDYQQQFWRQVVELVPDAEEGTVVLVEPGGLRDTTQIDANTWNLPRVLPQLYHFPRDWEEPPRVYRLVSNWQAHIQEQPGEFRLFNLTVTSPTGYYGPVHLNEVVFLESENGALSRAEHGLLLGEERLPLKPRSDTVLPELETRWLYHQLIE